MVKITKGNIFHTRGDTANFHINITTGEESVTDYTAKFSVKRNLTDTDYLLQKNVENGTIYLSHQDTQALPYGTYYYDIELCINDGTDGGRYATIGPYEYRLLPDVTTV